LQPTVLALAASTFSGAAESMVVMAAESMVSGATATKLAQQMLTATF
jgi:hypothetical protein